MTTRCVKAGKLVSFLISVEAKNRTDTGFLDTDFPWPSEPPTYDVSTRKNALLWCDGGVAAEDRSPRPARRFSLGVEGRDAANCRAISVMMRVMGS
jgi:hypothetical protein